MKYSCRYQFIDVTNFDFVRDNSVEAANCGIKRGDVTVCTNMNIDTSSLTQIQIPKSKVRKKHKYVLWY